MKNLKEIEKIYYNYEHLDDKYMDFPDTVEARDKTMDFLEKHKMPEKIRFEVDSLLGEIAVKSEKMGFVYGFQYAIRLLIGEGSAL